MKKALSLTLATALTLSLFAGCSSQPAETPAPEAAAFTYADTIAWDGQYDVVVIGFGGSGATAAATAADAGAKVLLTEKAPEGHEGGNTRYCGQLFAYGHEDEEATLEYYKALAGEHEIPEAQLKVYTQNIAHMRDIMSDFLGLDQADFVDWTGTPRIGSMSPEYPEFPGADKISLDTLHQGISDGYLWKQLRKQVTDRADSIDVWFESPATHLIQDPTTKTILGVEIEREGETVRIRANNGVVMAMGGFENNPEMLADYLGVTDGRVIGGLYNTGDGINMALDAGADLWHMEAYEGIGGLGGSVVMIPEGERAPMLAGALTTGASIFIAGDGNRYLREDEGSRHGHIKMGDSWQNARRPLNSFAICTETVYNAAVESAGIPANAMNIQSASSIAELAEKIGVNADALTATVERYNGYAKNGYDPEFGRSAASMAPIAGETFYAIELGTAILNTQGGARRNENAEVLDRAGQPIPHLYSAGEFGGITAFQYQGGGNIAECIIFGQIAGKNAAAAKNDTLTNYEPLQPVESNIRFTPGAVTDVVAGPNVELAENEYLGVSNNGMGGDLYVKVTMDGDKIAAVEVVQHTESEGISDPAFAQVPGAIVEANSVEVDNVTGATITSKAIKEAVTDALAQVK